MNRAEIIQQIINKINGKTYLEIGVQRAKNFYKIDAPHKIAVDPQFKIGITRRLKNFDQILKNRFYEKTSDAFFNEDALTVFTSRKLDVALVDGLHTYHQSLLDFQNCLNYLSARGVILFHDCNPLTVAAGDPDVQSPEEMQKKYPGVNGVWNGDVWKTIVHIRSLYKDLEVFVLDCDFGVGVVRRAKPSDTLNFSQKEIQSLSFDDLNNNRASFLNLKSPAYLNEFIRSL